LIIEEVDRTPDANISSISFSASKTFLVSCLLDDYSNGTVELLKGEQLVHIFDKFCEFNSPNICNLVVSFKRHLGGEHIDNILELKSKSRYDYIQELFPKTSSSTKGVYFQDVDKWCWEWN
jgi:hypothetical protein